MWTSISKVLLLLVLTSTLGTAEGRSLPLAEDEVLVPRAPEPRNVVLYQDIEPGYMYIAEDGRINYADHTYLYIWGNDQDKPLRIEIGVDPWPEATEAWVGVRVFPYDPKKPEFSAKGDTKKKWTLGTTSFTNNEIYDENTRTGVAMDALDGDYVYRTGAGNAKKLNACHQYVNNLATKHMKLSIPPDAQELWNRWDTFIVHGSEFDPKNPDLPKQLMPTLNVPIDEVRVTQENADRTPGVTTTYHCPRSLLGRRSCTKGAPLKPGEKGGNVGVNELGLLADSSTELSEDDVTGNNMKFSDLATIDKISSDQNGKTTLVRSGSRMQTFTTVGADVLKALGGAAAIAGAVFVILDFVDHNWVGGAIGAVGTAAAVAVGLAVEGPVGWVIGGLIAALMLILPGAFEKQHEPAKITDVQGIVQFAMFGDAKHTGNEQCQKGTKDVPGNKDCQVLYGAGALTMALGFNNFDAIVFLTQFNRGYAMTLPEIAKAFYVADPNKKGDGQDKMAVITCHNDKGVPAGKAGVVGGDRGDVCDHPTFSINRPLITLPFLGQTADKVFNRIIPAPNGDCKLVAFPGDQKIAQYDMTVNGMPSSIACGLTASINVDGKAIPIDPGNAKNPALGSDSGQTTDGQGGAYIAPPPAAPFKGLDKDYPCFHKDKDSFCLPGGQYSKQSGMGWEIGDMTSLTFPSGDWSLDVHYRHLTTMGRGRVPAPQYQDVDTSFKQNVDPPKPGDKPNDFINAMQGIDKSPKDTASFRINGPNDGPDDVCCLFMEPNFGGNVLCLGTGGGDLSDVWKDKAQSVSCHNGANMWIYAKSYGDTGGQLIRGNVLDLSQEPYGNAKETFSKNVKAVWILHPN